MVEELKIDIGRIVICAIKTQVHDLSIRTFHCILLRKQQQPTRHSPCLATQKRVLTMPHEPISFKNLRSNELLADLCAQVSRALQVRATKNRHWRIQIHTLFRACVVKIFEVLQGTLRRAHAVATTMAESRVLAEHLVSESLRVLLSHHEVYQGHQADKQERITCSLEC